MAVRLRPVKRIHCALSLGRLEVASVKTRPSGPVTRIDSLSFLRRPQETAQKTSAGASVPSSADRCSPESRPFSVGARAAKPAIRSPPAR